MDTDHDIATTLTFDIARDLISIAAEKAKSRICIFSKYPPHFSLLAIFGAALGEILEVSPRQDVEAMKKHINNIMNEVR